MKDPIAWRIIRWVYAAFYLISGLHMAGALLGIVPPPTLKLSPADAAFQDALAKTGFILPLLAAINTLSGVALLRRRTAPLGIVLLAPIVVVIFFTNSLLDTTWLWGTAHIVILIGLAWHFRAAFRPLWNYGMAAEHTDSQGA